MTEATKDATKKEEAESGRGLDRLAGVGEEVLKRLYEELDKNVRFHDTLQRLLDARGRLEKSALTRLGVASSDDVDALREEVAKLERRLAKVEGPARKESHARASSEAETPSEA